jgi:ABC-type multidrug transport system fused ATPase/permease subunit
VLGSLAITASLYCFQTAFAAVQTGEPAAPTPRPGVAFGVALAGFGLLSLCAALLDHWSWVVRLRLLSAYEAASVVRGLRTVARADPRRRALRPRREMLQAVRGDSKSLRLVFQMLLLSGASLLQVIWPLAYCATLDRGMTAVALAALALGWLPIAWLGRRSAQLAPERLDATQAFGAEVSGLIRRLRDRQRPEAERSGAIEDVRARLEGQHLLWRRQFALRSLAQKAPQVCALLGTYALIHWGVLRVRADSLGWGELFTFVVAARVLFAPFSALGSRFAKAAEHWTRARRHLAFLRSVGAAPALRRFDPQSAPSLAVSGLVVPGAAVAAAPLDLALGPGSVLAIVDPAIERSNPLAQVLLAERPALAGSVRWCGELLDELDYASLRTAVADHDDKIPSLSGTLHECMQALAARPTSRAELEDFARRALDPGLLARLPKGLDTEVSIAAKKAHRIPRFAWRLLQLWSLHQRPKTIVVADLSGAAHPDCRGILRRYTERLRGDEITLWLDTAPRLAVPDQTVAVCVGGELRGAGSLDWFRRTFPDWDWEVQTEAAERFAREFGLETPDEPAAASDAGDSR